MLSYQKVGTKIMQVINYFESDKKEHWLERIKKCDWRAGAYLHELLTDGSFFEKVGEGSRLLLLTDGDELAAFCTYAKIDEIQPTELSPWIGFVYTFPKYRGRRLAGLLFEEAERLAKEEDKTRLYISTDHIGLYEKYGFDFRELAQTIYGKTSRVYEKRIGRNELWKFVN